jgi:glucose/arabinose dehydrogenase
MIMMHALGIARLPKLPRLAALFVAIAGLGLAGCDDNGGDPKIQIGANPVLPALQQYLMPPIRIAKAVGWGENETPAVAQGLQVHALATGFVHPRSLYVLPNGDVLVVESNGPKAPIYRPKDIITGWVQSFAGAKAKDENRITLLRDANGDGIPEVRTVFLDHLNSPFGVALIGHDLYVANTDAIVRYPYQEGQTSITAPGTKLTDLPGGPIDHHWTKALLASPDGSKLYVGVGSNSNITENGIGAEYERAAIWEVDRASGAHRIFASGVRNPTGLAWEPESGKLWAVANERDEIGPDLVPDYLTSVQDGGFYGWPYSY